jgi:acyl-CoA hydrolase
MQTRQTLFLNVEQCVDRIIEVFGNDIKLGMPLGLGKPVPLVNALYRRAKADPRIQLTLFTALSLEKPVAGSDLEHLFLEPIVQREWEGVPDLDYMLDLRRGKIPPNVTIHELFCKAGAYRNFPQMQQNYMNTNYTHTHRDCVSMGVSCYGHMIAKKETAGGTVYSASCNADTAVEALRDFARMQEKGQKSMTIGMVNGQLPYMYGDAELTAASYDVIIDDPQLYHPLFGTPRPVINAADYMIGIHVSTLIKDGGTLQIGIGALGDSIAYALGLRHNNNAVYKDLIEKSGIGPTYGSLIGSIGGSDPFNEGLYGSTEMLVDGFLQLYKNGVIKRKIYHHVGIQRLINEGRLGETIPHDILKQMIDQETLHPYLTRKDFEGLQRFGVLKADLTYDSGMIVQGGRRFSANLADAANLEAVSESCLGRQLKNGVVLTGAFFIGPKDFYQTLRDMPESERQQFEMTGVDVANQLYGDELLRSLERKEGRFCNTGMKATLLGAIVSDGLEDGTVISGVGGQYNFVSMAHALPDGRLLMMIKSTRQEHGRILSNIVYNYGHVTIPRHLKDIVVTEYGIADIRGKCDQDIIKAMLNITDSRFQDELLAEAKIYKKIPEDYRIPEQFRNNTPQRLAETVNAYKMQGLFPEFPFGTIFSDIELMIAFALRTCKLQTAGADESEISDIMKALPDEAPANLAPFMERMQLQNPATPEAQQAQKALLLAFKVAGFF